ncbi:hypothetical protein ACCO45_007889 [Purpureocillium lilacinum]|uniref:Uncharacterized protein n=1 Tax=Purpureocillium lilacinum TaxID=33203 RepID=A0ACC4DPE6_PURLI
MQPLDSGVVHPAGAPAGGAGDELAKVGALRAIRSATGADLSWEYQSNNADSAQPIMVTDRYRRGSTTSAEPARSHSTAMRHCSMSSSRWAVPPWSNCGANARHCAVLPLHWSDRIHVVLQSAEYHRGYYATAIQPRTTRVRTHFDARFVFSNAAPNSQTLMAHALVAQIATGSSIDARAAFIQAAATSGLNPLR